MASLVRGWLRKRRRPAIPAELPSSVLPDGSVLQPPAPDASAKDEDFLAAMHVTLTLLESRSQQLSQSLHVFTSKEAWLEVREDILRPLAVSAHSSSSKSSCGVSECVLLPNQPLAAHVLPYYLLPRAPNFCALTLAHAVACSLDRHFLTEMRVSEGSEGYVRKRPSHNDLIESDRHEGTVRMRSMSSPEMRHAIERADFESRCKKWHKKHGCDFLEVKLAETEARAAKLAAKLAACEVDANVMACKDTNERLKIRFKHRKYKARLDRSLRQLAYLQERNR